MSTTSWSRPGNPPDPRPAVRIHALAAALEKDRLRPVGGASAVGGGAAAGPARARAPRVPPGGLLGSQGAAHQRQEFDAELVSVKGVRVASGKDFDEKTGKLAADKKWCCWTSPRPQNFAIACRKAPAGRRQRREARHPPARRAVHDIHAAAGSQPQAPAVGPDTMRVAQSLYENGFITYMRTDSVHLSGQAVTAARECVERLYGASYLPPKPRHYSAKNVHAQEAHEAIRPAGSLSHPRRDQADRPGVRPRSHLEAHRRLPDARRPITSVVVTFEVDDATFRATGKRIDFRDSSAPTSKAATT